MRAVQPRRKIARCAKVLVNRSQMMHEGRFVVAVIFLGLHLWHLDHVENDQVESRSQEAKMPQRRHDYSIQESDGRQHII